MKWGNEGGRGYGTSGSVGRRKAKRKAPKSGTPRGLRKAAEAYNAAAKKRREAITGKAKAVGVAGSKTTAPAVAAPAVQPRVAKPKAEPTVFTTFVRTGMIAKGDKTAYACKGENGYIGNLYLTLDRPSLTVTISEAHSNIGLSHHARPLPAVVAERPERGQSAVWPRAAKRRRKAARKVSAPSGSRKVISVSGTERDVANPTGPAPFKSRVDGRSRKGRRARYIGTYGARKPGGQFAGPGWWREQP